MSAAPSSTSCNMGCFTDGRGNICGKAPGAQMIASVTFIAILMTILIQAPVHESLSWHFSNLGNQAEKVGSLM